jgi:hypothetical protein
MIPLLVKEKVKFYYYFNKWKENIKIMHDEYNKRVEISSENGPDGNIIISELRFRQRNGITSHIRYLNFLFSNKELQYMTGSKFLIYNFTRYCKATQSAPYNYRYSSGRNNRKGFY